MAGQGIQGGFCCDAGKEPRGCNVCVSMFDVGWTGSLAFLQSPEGGRLIAAIGGVLVILYYLRKGVVPVGRPLAVLLSIVFVALLSTVMLQAIDSWDANMKAQCSAYGLDRILEVSKLYQQASRE